MSPTCYQLHPHNHIAERQPRRQIATHPIRTLELRADISGGQQTERGVFRRHQVLYGVPSLLVSSHPEWTSSTPVPVWSGEITVSP